MQIIKSDKIQLAISWNLIFVTILLFSTLQLRAQPEVNPYNSYLPNSLEGHVLGIIERETGRVRDLYQYWDPEEVSEMLLHIYEESDQAATKRRIIWKLCSVDDPDVLPFLISQLHAEENDVRAVTIMVLRIKGNPIAAQPLAQYLKDNWPSNLTDHVVDALSLITTREACDALKAFAANFSEGDTWYDILPPIRQRTEGYLLARNKRRYLETLLQEQDYNFDWAISKIRQTDTPKPSASFLRRMSRRLAKDRTRRSDYRRLLALRSFLKYDLDETERQVLEIISRRN